MPKKTIPQPKPSAQLGIGTLFGIRWPTLTQIISRLFWHFVPYLKKDHYRKNIKN